MTTTRGSYDFTVAKEAHDDAETKATNYLADVSDGVFIHSDGAPDDPTDIEARGVYITDQVDIIRNGESYAEFGEGARIGQDEKSRVIINSDEFTAYNDNNIPFFSVDYDGGIETIVTDRTYSIGGSDVFNFNKTLQADTKTLLRSISRTSNYISNVTYTPYNIYIRFNSVRFGRYDFYITDTIVNRSESGITVSGYSRSAISSVVIDGQTRYMYRVNYTIKIPTSDFIITSTGDIYTKNGYITLATNKNTNIKIDFKLNYKAKDNNRCQVDYKVYATNSSDSISLNGTISTNCQYKYVTQITTQSAAPSYTLGYRDVVDENGGYSLAVGKSIHAENSYQTAIGKFNDNQSDTAFEIGNGNGVVNDPNERSNALTVDWSGNVDIASGAAYSIGGVAIVDHVIEIDTDSGWTYRKWASGRMEAFGTVTVGSTWTLIGSAGFAYASKTLSPPTGMTVERGYANPLTTSAYLTGAQVQIGTNVVLQVHRLASSSASFSYRVTLIGTYS